MQINAMSECRAPSLMGFAMLQCKASLVGVSPRSAVVAALPRRLMRLVAVAAVALSASACESGYFSDRVPSLASESAGSELVGPLTPKYTIGPGDELLINSFYHSDLKQPVTVQSDGRVSLLWWGQSRRRARRRGG